LLTNFEKKFGKNFFADRPTESPPEPAPLKNGAGMKKQIGLRRGQKVGIYRSKKKNFFCEKVRERRFIAEKSMQPAAF
jgi:hypothetical protein